MRTIGDGLHLLVFCILSVMPLMSGPSANAAEPPGAGTSSGAVSGLLSRMNQLESRVAGLETEVTQLRRENQSMRAALNREDGSSDAAKAPQVANVSGTAHEKLARARMAEDSTLSESPESEWGARFVYQGFPFKQREGGLGYSFFFAHRLFSEGDQVPLGDLETEIALGIARSGVDHVNVFSQVTLSRQDIGLRQNILWLWPSLKYCLNNWTDYGVRPYVIGGAGIWGDIVESAPLFVGEAPQAGELLPRKLPIDGSANIFEGGQGGAGIELSLARTRIPIIDRLSLGFDYRYSAWVSGQRYNAYSLSLFASD